MSDPVTDVFASIFGGNKADGKTTQNVAPVAKKAAPVAKKPAQKEVSEKAKQAEQTLRQSKPRSTISLFGLGKSDDDDSPVSAKAASPPAPVKPQLMSAAPRGVPTIRKWKQNRDKSVSGTIFGSRNFQEGDFITTSAILSNALGGSLVQTASGSRYYLEDPKAAAAAEQQKKSLAAERAKVQANDATKNKKEEAAKAKATAAAEKIKAAEAAKLAKEQEANAKAKAAAEAKASKAKQAQEATSQAKARASIPLPKVAPAVAPKGVPTLTKWKQNRDGSVTGSITGSEAFEKGMKITTSPIANGEFKAGSVVQTESGSRYFLN